MSSIKTPVAPVKASVAPTEVISPREQRRRVARLGGRGSDRDLPALLAGLHSPDRRIGVLAAISLGRVATARAAQALTENLCVCEDAGVVAVSARGLARLGEVGAVPSIEAVLMARGADTAGKQALVATLGGFAQRSSVAALSARLDDPDARTRKLTARALRRINYPESRRALEHAAGELSWWRGRWARRALSSMRADLAR